MFDGLFSKKPAQQTAAVPSKAPLQPQKPAASSPPAAASPPAASSRQPTVPMASKVTAVNQEHAPVMAGPLEMSKEQVGADFQSIVDEAAIVFAGGEEKAAADMLIDYLKKTNGQANRRVWFMLLDIYQALGQKEQYEKLSLMFANRFGTSPPSWEEALGEDSLKAQATSVAAKSSASGRNVMIVEGASADSLAGKAKDFIAASREMKSCKLDVSRMKMDQTSIAGIAALQNTMALLRKHKVAATLMGENHVASWLEKKIEATKGNADPSDSPFWMLLLEIYQWRGLMDVFEDMSLEYTMSFEVSGPGWEPSGVMTIEHVAEVEDDAGKNDNDDICPDEIITDISIQRMQDSINQAIVEKGVAKLDFRRVRRMAFSSAGTFLTMLASMGDPKKVVVVNPSELILALGDVVGFGPYVTIIPRKR